MWWDHRRSVDWQNGDNFVSLICHRKIASVERGWPGMTFKRRLFIHIWSCVAKRDAGSTKISVHCGSPGQSVAASLGHRMWFWKLLKLGRHVLQPYRRKERHVDAGGVRGVRIRQNRTEIRINTAQKNIRKLQTALKLAENFWIPQTAWFCTTAIQQLKKRFPPNRTKNGAKPHHRKPIVFKRRSYGLHAVLTGGRNRSVQNCSYSFYPFELKRSFKIIYFFRDQSKVKFSCQYCDVISSPKTEIQNLITMDT